MAPDDDRASYRRPAAGFSDGLAATRLCNHKHSVNQRCCRWLLVVSDRCNAHRFPLAEGFLAQMLGVSAPTIARALVDLQRDGIATYGRGQIDILDRVRMERSSCQCYSSTAR